jgi:hypothetical protein
MARSSFNIFRCSTPSEQHTEINSTTNSRQPPPSQSVSLNDDNPHSNRTLRALRTEWSASTEVIQALDPSSAEFAEKLNTALIGTNRNLKLFIAQHGFMLNDETLMQHALEVVKQPGSVYKLSYLLGAMRRMPSAGQLQTLRLATDNDSAIVDFISSLENTRKVFSRMGQGVRAEQVPSVLIQYKVSVFDEHLKWICKHVTLNQWVRKAGEEWQEMSALSFIADLGESGLLAEAIVNLPIQFEDLMKVRTANGFALLLKETNFSNADVSGHIRELGIRAVMLNSTNAVNFLEHVSHSALKNKCGLLSTPLPYRSPLHAAIATGNVPMVALLIQQGAVPTGFELVQAEHASPAIKDHVRRAFDAWDSNFDAAFGLYAHDSL